MSKNTELDSLKDMTARIEEMMLAAEKMVGSGVQMREAAQTVGAFSKQQEEKEKEAWREAVRAAALGILPALPEININSWDITVGYDVLPGKKVLGVPVQANKKIPIKVKAYPLAYLSEPSRPNGGRERKSDGSVTFNYNMVEILMVDENGKLWAQVCNVDIPVSAYLTSVGHFRGRPLSLVRSREEIQELASQRGRLSYHDVPILVNQGYQGVRPWEQEEKCQLGREKYENLAGMINRLFRDHEAWMSQQEMRINRVLEKANSPLLEEIVKVPSLKR